MKLADIERLLGLIDEIVHEPKTWQDKRDGIWAEASDQHKANLEEFAAWFARE